MTAAVVFFLALGVAVVTAVSNNRLSPSLARREEVLENSQGNSITQSTLPDLQSRETRPAAYNDALMQAVRENLSKYRSKIDAQSSNMSMLLSEAKRHSIGAIVVLLDTSDIRQMHDIRHVLVPSLMDHIRFRTSVVVLFMGSLRRAEDATVNLHLNTFLDLHFEDVTARVQEVSDGELKNCKNSKQSDDWKIQQFWTMQAHTLSALEAYRYAWRLLPSSSIDADVTSDLYEVMKEQNATFGYRTLRNEKTTVCTGLEDATKKFFQEHTALAPKMLNSKAYLSLFEEAKCPAWSPDFQITDLDYLRSSGAYQQFVGHLLHMGGFCKFGWGGHGIQAMFIETLEEGTQRLLCTKPWVPKFHGPLASIDCQDGESLIAVLRDTINEQLHSPKASMGEVQEVKRNATAKSKKLEKLLGSPSTKRMVEALAFVLHVWNRWKTYILILLVVGLLGAANVGGYIYLRLVRLRQKQEREEMRATAAMQK